MLFRHIRHNPVYNLREPFCLLHYNERDKLSLSEGQIVCGPAYFLFPFLLPIGKVPLRKIFFKSGAYYFTYSRICMKRYTIQYSKEF